MSQLPGMQSEGVPGIRGACPRFTGDPWAHFPTPPREDVTDSETAGPVLPGEIIRTPYRRMGLWFGSIWFSVDLLRSLN